MGCIFVCGEKMLKELLKKTRSYRRFDHSVKITREELTDIVEIYRLLPSAMNHQPLKFYIACDEEIVDKLFEYTFWAGAIKDGKPVSEESPVAYIVICFDKSIGGCCDWDAGITSLALMERAVEMGYGGTIIGSFTKDKFIEILGIEEGLEPNLILALGKPIENVILTDPKDGEITYYRDENRNHYVPKRPISEILKN